MKIKLSIFCFIFCLNTIVAQINNVYFQPGTSGKDVYVSSYQPTTNFEGEDDLVVTNLDFGSLNVTGRTLIEIDLTPVPNNGTVPIPSNAIILDAKLYIYRSTGATNSTTMEVNKVIEDWDEDIVTWASAPNVTNSDMKTQSLSPVDYTWHSIDVTSHVQEFVNYPNLNKGWRLKCQSESSSNGSTYLSSEFATAAYRPKLTISYVLPIEITLDEIIHADTPTSTNGSISINVAEGDGTYTYQWIDGATGSDISGETSSSISGLSPGWYGIEVTDGLGNISYMAFVVGAKCGIVQIEFQPDTRFVDDTYVIEDYINGITDNVNYGSNNFLYLQRFYISGFANNISEILFKNRIIIPDNIELTLAEQHCYGYNHANGNKCKINNVNDEWSEDIVTWNVKPSYGAIITTIPSTTSSNENLVLDFTNLYKDYQDGTLINNGQSMALNYFPMPSSFRKRQYYSSDHSTATERPKLVLRIGELCSKFYTELQRKLDGGHYNSINDTVSFIHREEYQDTDGLLDFRVLNYQGSEVLNSSNQDVFIQPGYNEIDLDVSSLSSGFYVLEVTNEKNEKLKLRFKI